MFWHPKVIFIHVPRTGGTALTEIFGALPHVSKDVHKCKHLPASVVRDWMPDYWATATKIAVYRPNAEISQSWYDHVQVSLDIDQRHADQSWIEYITRCHGMSYEEFADSEPMPTMEQYVDCEGVQVLPWVEAFATIRQILLASAKITEKRWV